MNRQVYFRIGDSLPYNAGINRMPYSEVCMHMRIAGHCMGWKIVGQNAVQLFDKLGNVWSAPITLGEAGFYQDSRGIYRYMDAAETDGEL